MSTAGIRFEGVGLVRGDKVVLDRVNLNLTEHRVGVVGLNGSGKSTMVRMVNGLVRPTAGRVFVDGLDVAARVDTVRAKVGFLFSDADHQIVMPTVAEDLDFSLRGQRLGRAGRAAAVAGALEEFGLADLADHPCHALSGEKQLLALAAVLLTRPDIVVADEPTTLLDRVNARLVVGRLAALEQRVLLVTHHLELLADFERVVVLDQGRVVADGAPDVAIAHYLQLAD